MNDALYIAATGMQTQQLAVDTIANNLANATTPGYKSGRVNFQELMYRDAVTHADGAQRDPAADASAIAQGSGVGVASLVKSFAPGTLTPTANPLDLAIKGDGFVEVQMADGSTAYWRGGTLQVSADGWLATSSGQLLKPQIRVDKSVDALTIAADGKITAQKTGANPVQLGQIALHVFPNEGGLRPLGGALYQASDASGDATQMGPADVGAGTFVQGASEQSNVVLVDEMVNLMMAQRAYEMNLKAIQAADDMIGMSNNLRK